MVVPATVQLQSNVLCWLWLPPRVRLQVRFSTKSFGVDAATVAAEALRAVAATLEHADMSDIIAGRPVRRQQQQQRQRQTLRAWVQPLAHYSFTPHQAVLLV